METTSNRELKQGGPEPPGALIPAEVVRRELSKILASRVFRSARGQRDFLRYIVQETLAGRRHLLKEYIIGVEALGKGNSFDPRLDPIVRTQARKLRVRLEKYYATEGQGSPLRIEFRKGSYAVFFVGGEIPHPLDLVPAPEAVSEAPHVPAFEPPPVRAGPSLHWKTIAAGVIVLILAASSSSGLNALRSRSRDDSSPANGSAVAVLPFVNLSQKPEDEFLSDGLTEELIDSLRQIPGVQVLARASAFRFKAQPFDVQAITTKLHVATLLTGSLLKDGDRLRVTVQLNRAVDNRHLWSGSYDRTIEDARAIESEITLAVAGVLETALPHAVERPVEESRPSRAAPAPDAYRDYLKGLYFWNKATADGLAKAIQYFQQAIASDPSFARAYTALADCYVMAPVVATTPPAEASAKIMRAAIRALELDSSIGDPHFDLAVGAEYEFDWATAEREFERGLELSPGNSVGHLWYGRYLLLMGRRDEALAQRKMAAQLDPVSPYAINAVASYFSSVGRYDEAIREFRNALALDPNFGLSHEGLGMVYLRKGMPAEAIDELQLVSKSLRGPRRAAILGYAYAVCGKTEEARQILKTLLSESQRESFPALSIAQVYIGLGEKDRAFEWLEKAIDQRDLDLSLEWNVMYAPLRTDARFAKLLQRMKIV